MVSDEAIRRWAKQSTEASFQLSKGVDKLLDEEAAKLKKLNQLIPELTADDTFELAMRLVRLEAFAHRLIDLSDQERRMISLGQIQDWAKAAIYVRAIYWSWTNGEDLRIGGAWPDQQSAIEDARWHLEEEWFADFRAQFDLSRIYLVKIESTADGDVRKSKRYKVRRIDEELRGHVPSKEIADFVRDNFDGED